MFMLPEAIVTCACPQEAWMGGTLQLGQFYLFPRSIHSVRFPLLGPMEALPQL